MENNKGEKPKVENVVDFATRRKEAEKNKEKNELDKEERRTELQKALEIANKGIKEVEKVLASIPEENQDSAEIRNLREALENIWYKEKNRIEGELLKLDNPKFEEISRKEKDSERKIMQMKQEISWLEGALQVRKLKWAEIVKLSYAEFTLTGNSKEQFNQYLENAIESRKNTNNIVEFPVQKAKQGERVEFKKAEIEELMKIQEELNIVEERIETAEKMKNEIEEGIENTEQMKNEIEEGIENTEKQEPVQEEVIEKTEEAIEEETGEVAEEEDNIIDPGMKNRTNLDNIDKSLEYAYKDREELQIELLKFDPLSKKLYRKLEKAREKLKETKEEHSWFYGARQLIKEKESRSEGINEELMLDIENIKEVIGNKIGEYLQTKERGKDGVMLDYTPEINAKQDELDVLEKIEELVHTEVHMDIVIPVIQKLKERNALYETDDEEAIRQADEEVAIAIREFETRMGGNIDYEI